MIYKSSSFKIFPASYGVPATLKLVQVLHLPLKPKQMTPFKKAQILVLVVLVGATGGRPAGKPTPVFYRSMVAILQKGDCQSPLQTG